MKAKVLFIALVLLTIIPWGISLAQEDGIELSAPANMPDKYIDCCRIEGTKTNGVTFVIKNVEYNDSLLKIDIVQLPNDDYTSLVDNQVDNDPSLTNKVETASQYGSQILGTLCDVLTLTDGNGNKVLKEYGASSSRNGSSLTNEFRIDLPAEHTGEKISIEFVFGVNEDLSSLFPMSDSIKLCIWLQDHISVVPIDD